MHRFALHNEEICEASAKVLAPGQIGLLSGWGVFSTLRVVRGIPFAFERHWDRMKHDAAILHVPFPEDREAVRSQLLRLICANQASEGSLRLIVVRNQGGVWAGPSSTPYDLIAFTTGAKSWAGVRLAVHEQARHAASRFRGVKMLAWALNLVMLEDAQSRGCDEVVLLNERGEVCECTSANIFVAQGGEVWTPPLESGCLPGVTRALLLDTVRVDGVPVREKVLHLEDLEGAEEVFITSTTRNLLPVISVEGRPVNHTGNSRELLSAAFERYVDAYLTERK
jgi:branched-chain amino acid aminotransferase